MQASKKDTTTTAPKKRGRKSRQELLDIINSSSSAVAEPVAVEPVSVEPVAVVEDVVAVLPRIRRGRKPNSSKIVENVNAVNIHTAFNASKSTNLPSVILHLNCRDFDTLESNDYTFCDISHYDAHHLGSEINETNDTDNDNDNNNNNESAELGLPINHKLEKTPPKLVYDYSNILNQTDLAVAHSGVPSASATATATVATNSVAIQPKHMLKEINKKIKHLDFILSSGIEIKRSACFWCTECFQNPPIYIPKHKCDETFQVYGNFCTLECAAAYLMKSSVHKSDAMEQYALLHSLYLDCAPTAMNGIKPAPEPRYMLDKFLGNLSIDEYRSLNNTNRFFILLDKPITKITPEYHEEYSNFRIQEKNIPSASS